MILKKIFQLQKTVFQIYEFTRLALINEFKLCKVEKSLLAAEALKEIKYLEKCKIEKDMVQNILKSAYV